MKTAVEYRQAVLRGWRLLVLLAVLGAAVGLVRPVHNAAAGPAGWLGSVELVPTQGLTLATMVADASSHNVVVQAAQAAHIPGPYTALAAAVGRPSKKSLGGIAVHAVEFAFNQPTKARALALASSFGPALQSYITNNAQTAYANEVQQNAVTVSCLEGELSTVEDDIQTEQGAPGSVDATNLFGDNGSGGSCTNSSSGSGSGGSSSDSWSSGPAPALTLTTSPSTVPASAGAGAGASSAGAGAGSAGAGAGSGAGAGGGAGDGSAAANAGDATLTTLDLAKVVLTSQLRAALTTQAGLASGGPATPSMQTLQSPEATSAKTKGKSISSITNNRGANLLGGALFGALLAAGIVAAVETLDRSLRSARQVEQVFEMPVVGEIPLAPGSARPRPGDPPPPTRLDVAVDPTSPVADAYRRLRTAVLIEPLSAERAMIEDAYIQATDGVYRGAGQASAPAPAPTKGSYANGSQANGSQANGSHANGSQPQATKRERGRRRVVMVVSPSGEATRGAVIANLAATYAQSGERALVITLGKLGWQPNGTNLSRTPPAGSGDFGPADIVPLSSPTMLPGVRRLAFDQVLASRGQVPSYGPAVIAASRDVADVVIVDGLGLLESRDALVLLPEVDVLLMVAEFGTTSAVQAKDAAEVLRRFSAPVLGAVFTNAPTNLKAPALPPASDTSSEMLFGLDEPTLTMPLPQ